jgi:hypothetical protein
MTAFEDSSWRYFAENESSRPFAYLHMTDSSNNETQGRRPLVPLPLRFIRRFKADCTEIPLRLGEQVLVGRDGRKWCILDLAHLAAMNTYIL